MSRLAGKALALGFVVTIVGATVPVYFYPKYSPDSYKGVQTVTRKDIKQEDVQPGDMKIWSDPFDRKKE